MRNCGAPNMNMKLGEWAWVLLIGFLALNIQLSVQVLEDLYVDDECDLKHGGKGVCKAITECVWYRDNFKKGAMTYRDTVRCGFEKEIEIICCGGGSLMTASKFGKAEKACDSYPPFVELGNHIINGQSTDAGEFPFVVALGYKSEEVGVDYTWDCGASLISSNYLLTAAHCIVLKNRPVIAKLGAISLNSTAQHIRIKDWHQHPNYTKLKNYNDIGLVLLDTPAVLDEYVQPACLYDAIDDLRSSETLWAEGWGITNYSQGIRSKLLLKVNLTTVERHQCHQTFLQQNLVKFKLSEGIIPSQYCATGSKIGEEYGDTCQGDSGGPLQIFLKDKYRIVGITSFGHGCGGDTPSVYTRVAFFIEWIESIVWR